ncbi:MAG: hypothetical protein INQ03_07800 [Candidatus Heimdallarchaeota archaeon]|nr:hypothetical protein [Candidatus Heimdallarchaeota archaeon]
MVEYIPFEEGIEVNGSTVASVLAGMDMFRKIAIEKLEKVGITELINDVTHWYSQKAWLQAFKLISQDVGGNTLHNIGRKIPENAIFPKEVNSIIGALASIDIAYHMNHRNRFGEILYNEETGEMIEGIGHYTTRQVSDSRIDMICTNPYPCEFDRGIVITMARRFQENAIVHHEDGECRKLGDDSCIYSVVW